MGLIANFGRTPTIEPWYHGVGTPKTGGRRRADALIPCKAARAARSRESAPATLRTYPGSALP